MKRVIILGIAIMSIFSCTTSKDETKKVINDNTPSNMDNEYLTSKTPYPFESTIYTHEPDDYKVVFIDYVGRHGSRHLSSPKYDVTLKELLDIASEANEITKTGLELRDEIEKLIIIEDGNYGELSKQGRFELQNIGIRISNNFSELFSNKPHIETQATFKHRTQDSRDNFVIGLKKSDRSIQTNDINYEEELDPYLRPYDVSTKFLNHEEGYGWKDLYESYEKNEIGNKYSKEILLKLFTENFYKRLEEGEFELLDSKGRVKLDSPQDAASNLYNLYIISSNLKAESNLNFRKYFTDNQLKWYESVLAIEDFYEKGPSTTKIDITSNIMAPLVKDMILSVDKKSDLAGVFRFAHAETIIPLATFLDIKTANKSSDNPEEVMDIWDISSISPMAANVQWIIYSNGSNKLVKMLYNEIEIKFPDAIKPVSGVYYNWLDIKNYYTNKIESLGLKMSNSLEEDLEFLINN